MTKLLKSHREALTKHLLDATFRERELRLKQQEHALGIRLLHAWYSAGELHRMNELPDGWLPQTTRLQFVVGKTDTAIYPKMSHYVKLSDPVRLPALHDFYKEAPSTWLVKWSALAEKHRALDEERKQLTTQITGTLAAFTTVEKLAQGWPEGYAHFPHRDLAAVGQFPALRIEDLNTRLAAAREAA